MLFSYKPVEEIYEAARAIIQSAEKGEALDITALQAAVGRLESVAADRRQCANHVMLAQDDMYDQVQVDPHPFVAVTDDGAWVNAWLFVPDQK